MIATRDTRKYVLAIDAGTTCVTVMLFDRHAHRVTDASAEIEQHYPQPGWVEHDAEEIRDAVLSLMQRAAGSVPPEEIAAIGITNQRETAILWDRSTGRPVCNAIVWQCRRTQEICERLERQGLGPKIHAATGLRLDSYFSATKIMWMLDNVPGLRERCIKGEIAFGTVDSWLLWNLTGGAVHATEPTNASRTLLYNIDTRQWDDDLLSALDIPRAILPEVRETSCHFGNCVASVLGEEVEIHSLVGDQQGALFGQGCVSAGEAKNTYGTGCFLLVNTGVERHDSHQGLLTTLACGPRGQVVYALEGAMFSAGAAVQWLRDGLGMIRKPQETEELAASVPDTGGVYLVPAFTGLGAPYWNMAARGAILGLTRGSNKAHLARATLECIAYQVADLVELAARETGITLPALKADGGGSSNEFLMQFQADILGIPIEIPDNIETTALGAAMLAGLSSGVWHTAEELDGLRRVGKVYKPNLTEAKRKSLLDGWRAAIEAVLHYRIRG
ncbi:MAG TPA: glycerol kinase GlpK [Planctomycetota bacterium]|nr:glycerol kinase GlpK [Planctomycetota bacterium]